MLIFIKIVIALLFISRIWIAVNELQTDMHSLLYEEVKKRLSVNVSDETIEKIVKGLLVFRTVWNGIVIVAFGLFLFL